MKVFLFLMILFNTVNFLPKQSLMQVTPTTILNEQTIAVLETDTGTVYAGTDIGLFKATDGLNFHRIADSTIGNEIVHTIVISANQQIIYVGTTHGLFKSTDGINFNPIYQRTFGALTILAVSTSNDGQIVYAGTSDGVYKSIDGTNFTHIVVDHTVLSPVYALFYDFVHSKLYVGLNDGLYISSDDINFTHPITGFMFICIMKNSDNNTIYAGGERGLFKSQDGNRFDAISVAALSKRVVSLVEDVNNHTIYAGTMDNLYRANDGENFALDAVNINSVVRALVVSNDGATLYIGADDGLKILPLAISVWTNNSLFVLAIIASAILIISNITLVTIYTIKIRHSYYKI